MKFQLFSYNSDNYLLNKLEPNFNQRFLVENGNFRIIQFFFQNTRNDH